MKVLQINSVCGIRSTGRICTDLAQVLEQQGHECKIAYGRETVPEQFQRFAVRIGNELGVRWDGVQTRLFDNAGFHSKTATKRFLSWVKEYDPDVIHLHNLHGYYIHIGLLFEYLKESGKPVVWTLHDCWPFTGHCSHFDWIGCEKWKTQCDHCPQRDTYPTSLFIDRAKRNFEEKKMIFCGVPNLTLVSPSAWLKDLAEESFLKEYPVRMIRNGIDLTHFSPTFGEFRRMYNITDKKLFLGVSSIWDHRKGFDAFLRGASLLGKDEVFVLVGLSKKQNKQLPTNIVGIERTNSVQQLAEIYSAADVFLNPTLEDNYPTVNLEAQACGTPVVTYRTGGSPESVCNKNGKVVPKGDFPELLRAARDIVCDREAVQSHAQQFNKQDKYLQYLRLYEECLCD